jgi:hypothetical protein
MFQSAVSNALIARGDGAVLEYRHSHGAKLFLVSADRKKFCGGGQKKERRIVGPPLKRELESTRCRFDANLKIGFSKEAGSP